MGLNVLFDNINIGLWDSFVKNHPYGNVFQTPDFYYVYKQSKKHNPIIVCVEDNNKEIVGIMLAVIIKEYDGILGHLSSRSIIIGGPLVKNDDLEILYILLNEYKRKIKGKAIYSQFRNMRDWSFAKGVFKNLDFFHEDHLDILIDLNKEKDELWSACSRERRKRIKKGLSHLVVNEIRLGEHIDEIYMLLNNVYNRIKLPIPGRDFFLNASIILEKKGYLRTVGSFKDSNLAGFRMVICYKDLIYDWYAGADDSFLEYRPNDVLPWHIFLWGKQNGFKVFDFGGAGKPNIPYGVRDYKLKFGGKLVNFGRFELVHKPLIYKIAKFGFKIYQLIGK